MPESTPETLYAIDEIERFLVDVTETQQITFTDPHGVAIAADEVFAAGYALPIFVIAATSIAKNDWQWSEEIVLYSFEVDAKALTGYRLVNNPGVAEERFESAKMLILLYLLQTLNTLAAQVGGEKDSDGKVEISLEGVFAYLEGDEVALEKINERENND